MTVAEGGGVLVVPRDALLGERGFEGFSPAGAHDYRSLILRAYRYAPRAAVEEDPSLKQAVPYCAIFDPAARTLLAYRRAEAAGDYAEARLRGKWSIGIGGHVEPSDGRIPDPFDASLRREMREELGLDLAGKLRLLGYINHDGDMVGRVHFGLCYVLACALPASIPGSREIAEIRLVSPETWRAMLVDPACVVEGWSRFLSGPLLEAMGGVNGLPRPPLAAVPRLPVSLQ